MWRRELKIFVTPDSDREDIRHDIDCLRYLREGATDPDEVERIESLIEKREVWLRSKDDPPSPRPETEAQEAFVPWSFMDKRGWLIGPPMTLEHVQGALRGDFYFTIFDFYRSELYHTVLRWHREGTGPPDEDLSWIEEIEWDRLC